MKLPADQIGQGELFVFDLQFGLQPIDPVFAKHQAATMNIKIQGGNKGCHSLTVHQWEETVKTRRS